MITPGKKPTPPKKNALIRLHMGDVITSSDLVCCKFNSWDYIDDKPKNKHLSLCRGQKTYKIKYHKDWTEEREGKEVECSQWVIRDEASYDLSRNEAKFLVEHAGLGGGGSGHGVNDVYPDGWELSLRRLDADGSYSPESETIHCYENNTGCFIQEIYITKYTIVGKMAKTFVKVKDEEAD
jgi:hypothetical protein